jgi:hypothetical protein
MPRPGDGQSWAIASANASPYVEASRKGQKGRKRVLYPNGVRSPVSLPNVCRARPPYSPGGARVTGRAIVPRWGTKPSSAPRSRVRCATPGFAILPFRAEAKTKCPLRPGRCYNVVRRCLRAREKDDARTAFKPFWDIREVSNEPELADWRWKDGRTATLRRPINTQRRRRCWQTRPGNETNKVVSVRNRVRTREFHSASKQIDGVSKQIDGR